MKSRDEQKNETRLRILKSAARLFRRRGITSTGVDLIMKNAGLTAGGFYAHFESKDSLVAESLARALSESKAHLLSASTATTKKSKTSAILDRYLSLEHRDQPENGCVLAALAGELPRLSSKTRDVFAQHIESWLQDFESQGLNRDQALRSMSSAVGAIILSRIVKGRALSEEILTAAKKN